MGLSLGLFMSYRCVILGLLLLLFLSFIIIIIFIIFDRMIFFLFFIRGCLENILYLLNRYVMKNNYFYFSSTFHFVNQICSFEILIERPRRGL